MATFLRPVSPFSVEVPSVHVFISFLAHRQVGGLWLQFPLSNHKQKVNTRVEEHSGFPCHVEFAAATILGKALKHGDLSPRGGICCLYQSVEILHIQDGCSQAPPRAIKQFQEAAHPACLHPQVLESHLSMSTPILNLDTVKCEVTAR